MTPSECCRLDWQILQAPSRLADRYSVTICLSVCAEHELFDIYGTASFITQKCQLVFHASVAL